MDDEKEAPVDDLVVSEDIDDVIAVADPGTEGATGGNAGTIRW